MFLSTRKVSDLLGIINFLYSDCREKRSRDRHLFGVSLDLPLQTRCRFDYAVLRARSPRQVVTPGDGGAGDSSPSSPYHRVIYCLCPSCRRAHCCQRSSQGHVFLLHIRVLPAQNYQVSTHDDDAFTSWVGRVQLVQMFMLFTCGMAEHVISTKSL